MQLRKTWMMMLCLLFSLYTIAQPNAKKLSIIPEPVSMVEKNGSFILPQNMKISAPQSGDMQSVNNYLKQKLSRATGKVVIVSSNDKKAHIKLELLSRADSRIGNEGYILTSNANGIVIKANKPAGIFYGVQTLMQLLPAEIESKTKVANVAWTIPYVEIVDYPRVGWRGLMLDVSRHFFTVEEVKQFIDNMVKYKYNMFHWHLTDDEGWRIEIKSLPKLTEVGAWRVEKIGKFGTFSKPTQDEPRNYGGFYTQEQIKDVVKYASERFVQIMPEIDVPGHSLAAVASYPELSCTPGADKYEPSAGDPFLDWSQGAPPIALIDNTLCPANEKVYTFLDKVMTELAHLFPFEYIHTGGDEASHNFWQKNPEVQALMKRENLKTIPQVQSYFGKRLEKIIQSKGKKMMGWDEIMEGGITPSTALMSWRGEKYGIEASKSGHPVVMSPTTFAYLDYMQADVSTEPQVYASLRLNQTYKFNPIPEGAVAKNILGGQANLWTEQIYNNRQLEYMIWPRALAISESLWSPKEMKNWKTFVPKVENHFLRFNQSQTKYSPAIYDPSVKVLKEGDVYKVELTPEIEGLEIYTSFDNSTPDNFYPKYTSALTVPKDASLMKIITYRDGKPIGRLMTISVENLRKRVK